MTEFTGSTWLILAGIAAFGMVQTLRALAIRVRNETAVHNLRVRVSELRAARLREQMIRHGIGGGGQTSGDFEIMEVGEADDDSGVIVAQAQAA